MIILDNYTNFMIFDLLDSGHRKRLNITEEEFIEDNGESLLKDDAVILILKEDIRRIYIWKGIESKVRKKFIASRVASKLQKELVKEVNFHRCKIVSIDQGDEPKEFLQAFHLNLAKIEPERESISRYEISNTSQKALKQSTSHLSENSVAIKESMKSIQYNNSQPKYGSTNNIHTQIQNPELLLTKIIDMEIPEGFQRKHLLLGKSNLYGLVSKKSEIFGEVVEEVEWEKIDDVSGTLVEINNHKLRIHIDKKINKVIAIEILENLSSPSENFKENRKRQINLDFNRWTVNALRKFCNENNISISSSNKKAEIIKILEDKYVKKQN